MINPTAAELALINIFIVVLIILEGIIRIGSGKSDYIERSRENIISPPSRFNL